MSTKEVYELFNGPSKDLLFDACKYAYSNIVRFPIDFNISPRRAMLMKDPGCDFASFEMQNVVITGIRNEDKTGNSFLLDGHCEAMLRGDTCLEEYDFMAHYNTRTRIGKIMFM